MEGDEKGKGGGNTRRDGGWTWVWQVRHSKFKERPAITKKKRKDRESLGYLTIFAMPLGCAV